MLNLHGRVYPFYMQNNAFVSDPQTWKKSIHDELQPDWDYSNASNPIVSLNIRFIQANFHQCIPSDATNS